MEVTFNEKIEEIRNILIERNSPILNTLEIVNGENSIYGALFSINFCDDYILNGGFNLEDNIVIINIMDFENDRDLLERVVEMLNNKVISDTKDANMTGAYLGFYANSENKLIAHGPVYKELPGPFLKGISGGMLVDIAETIISYVNKYLITAINKAEEEKNKKDSGCFITTAVCNNFGLNDNCYELNMFRTFRDKWLIKQCDGMKLINNYYQIAPNIVKNINKTRHPNIIYMNIWNRYLLPCLKYIQEGKYEECKSTYILMVKELSASFL